MTLPAIEALLVPGDATIRRAIAAIDANAQGVVFVVDEGGRLAGVATDGDIRRGLLAGRTLDSGVSEIMSRGVLSRPVESDERETAALLTDRVRHIPLVDGEGRPVDYACLHRLRHTPVLEPELAGNELAYVAECVKTNWISSQGRFVRQFEAMFVERHGVPHALAVANGTVAIHLALEALGVGEGDEVIVPDVTFAACANAVLHAKAVPVLAEVDAATWGLSAETVRPLIGPRTKAVMAVHLYGHPCDMDPLLALAREKGLLVVEDCAESLGSTYRGRPTGAFGDAATFSFFGNKTLTTGEGGMVLLREEAAARRGAILRDHGMSREKRYWHDEVGYNYRMTNLQAAIGVAQMERIEALLSAKRRVAAAYDELLAGAAGLSLPPRQPWAQSSYWLYTLLLDEALAPKRDELIRKLQRNGIDSRPAFYPLHEMPPYRALRRSAGLPVAERVSRGGLSLPSAVTLDRAEQARIARVLRSLLRTSELTSSL